MCGIIVCQSEWVGLEKAESLLSHRGISGHGRVERDGLFFSHFLHSVVGSNVMQPFEGNGVLVANCEIYNWKQLAEDYGVKGRNDAEVLFNILEEEKNLENRIISIMDDLDGDFACVYYRDGKLFAFRDPFGVNPLFYSINPLLFASERKVYEGLRELHPRNILSYDMRKQFLKFDYYDFFSKGSGAGCDVERLVFDAIDKRATEVPSGVLFSGGVDSLVISLRLYEIGKKVTLYTAYNGNSPDAQYAKNLSREYGFDHVDVEFSERDVESLVPTLCNVIDSSDSVKVGVAIPLYFASAAAKKDNKKVLYSGLGADDLFIGYFRSRGERAFDVHNEQKSSLRCIYERDLYRDNTVCMHNNVELRVPFLDKGLVQCALTLDKHLLDNKQVLRDMLRKHYKLSEKYYKRPKKAAQYGSGSMKILRRIAQKAKMSVSEYLLNVSKVRNIPLCSLYTGGKDSAYATYLMLQRNYPVKCLVTVRSLNPHSYMFHTPRIDMVRVHSEKMHIPVVEVESEGENEREVEDLERALKIARDNYGVEGVVTGALYSEYQRTRIEKVCDRLGLRVFSPLWHVDQEKYMHLLIKEGFRFIITKVAAEGLDPSYWVNREIDDKDVDLLVSLSKKYGINVAGEGGEFESLVLDCPLFKKRFINEG